MQFYYLTKLYVLYIQNNRSAIVQELNINSGNMALIIIIKEKLDIKI